jgi:hypothetical protein
VGLSQAESIKDAGDRHARLPMLWNADQDRELLAFYGELSALRRTLPAEPRVTIAAEGDRLAYARGRVVVEIDAGAASAVARDGADVLLRV